MQNYCQTVTLIFRRNIQENRSPDKQNSMSLSKHIEQKNTPQETESIPISENVCLRCHCARLRRNSLKGMEESRTTIFSQYPNRCNSSKNVSAAKTQMPHFFKTAMLLLVLYISSTSASPLHKEEFFERAYQSFISSSNLNKAAPESNGVKEATLLETLSQKSQNVERLPAFLHETLSRRRRSVASTCLPAFDNLSLLTGYAYKVASEARQQRLRRRNTVREITGRPWGSMLKYTHEELKRLYCEVSSVPSMFDDATRDVLTALRSMMNVMQQEMNVLNARFIGLSGCGRRPKPSQSKVLNDLYTLKVQLKTMCRKQLEEILTQV